MRTVGWAVTLAMSAAIIYGLVSGGFGEDASAIWARPWGKVSLIDLYSGLVIFGAWVALRETSWFRTGLWWIALATLGNLAAGLYLVRALMGSSDLSAALTGERSSPRSII